MLEDFWESLQAGWQNFLSSSEEKGLPLKSIADSLEEKGIPSLPVFLILVVALLGGAAYFLMSQQVLAPTNADVTITLKNTDGSSVSSATVYLVDDAGVLARQEGITDSEGKVVFSKLPIGSGFGVTVLDSDKTSSLPLEMSSISVGKTSEENSKEIFLSEAPAKTTVSVSVSVIGPANATFYLLDDFGIQVLGSEAKMGTSISFDVEPNSKYKIHVRAEGFTEETVNLATKGTDDSLPPIKMRAKGTLVDGTVSVGIFDSETENGIGSAKVDIRDAITGKSIATNLNTGSNGGITPQTIKLGTKIIVSALATGYAATVSDETTVTETTSIKLHLRKLSKEELTGIRIEVFDVNNGSVAAPIVSIFDSKGRKLNDSIPFDGVAIFSNLDSGQYYVTVTKPGFVPAFVEGAQKGKSYSVILEEADETNSAKAKVTVENQNAESVPQASVSLFYENGMPIGYDEKYAAADGNAEFIELPLVNVFAKASFSGRDGKSEIIELTPDGTGEEEGVNLLPIVLKPAKGTVVATLKDHFSGKNVENAEIQFSSSSTEFASLGSCITKNGKCRLQLQEGFYVARVKAAAYDEFFSSEFQVLPNVDNKADFEIIKSEVSDKSKIALQGIFDLSGNKVSSLSPSTVYNAKFLLTKPPIAVTKAEAQFRIGSADSALANEAAEITAYDASGAIVSKGTAYSETSMTSVVAETGTPTSEISVLPLETATAAEISPMASSELPSPTINYSSAKSELLQFQDVTISGEGSDPRYKYVHFSFAPFEGTKQMSVQFTTKSVGKGKIDFQYRSAFFTGKEVLREPLDASATATSFLANMDSVPLEIQYQGTCEGNVCAEEYFEGKSGTAENNFEVSISENFNLKFRLLAPKGTVVSVSAPAGEELQLTEGLSGSARARITSGVDKQELSITTEENNAEGQFSLLAKRIANDVPLTFTVTNGESTVTKTLSVRIVGEKPNMKVTFLPKQLEALKDNSLTFTVLDSLDLPIKNARVVIGESNDALRGGVFEAQSTEDKFGNIKYKIEAVKPLAVGSANYKVEADGFKISKGRIPVIANTLISLETKKVGLIVDSEDWQTIPIPIQNLLSNDVSISVQMIGGDGQYTDVEIDSASLKLKSQESKSMELRARISPAVVKVANKAQSLSEKLSGRLRITAKLGSTVQTEDVQFTVTSTVKQESLTDLWTVSAESLNYMLEPPKVALDYQALTVTNNAPHPLVVNFQTSSRSIYVSPISRTIEAGGNFEFKVYAKAADSGKCLFEDDDAKSKIDVFGSVLGVQARKKIDVAVMTRSTASCTAPTGSVTLPMQITLQLPASSKQKEQEGGTLVELPSGERLLFGSGAQIGTSSSFANSPLSYAGTSQTTGVSQGAGLFVSVPPGTPFYVPTSYIRTIPFSQPFQYDPSFLSPDLNSFTKGSTELRFPFQVFLDFDPETEFAREGLQTTASVSDIDITLPANVQLVRATYGPFMSAQWGGYGSQRRAFVPPNTPIQIQLTPFITSLNAIEVFFPTDVTFMLNEFVRTRKDDYTNSRAMQFSSGLTITFPSDAQVSTDSNDYKRITIPAQSRVLIPAPYALRAMNGEMKLQLPFRIMFKQHEAAGTDVGLNPGGITANSITTEDVEVRFAPAARVGLKLPDGSKAIEAAPLTQITLRPAGQYGIIGDSRVIPLPITIKLPATATIQKKASESSLIIFQNGESMKISSSSVVSKAEWDGSRTAEIPEGSAVTFTKGLLKTGRTDEGDEKFSLTIPAAMTLHFDLIGSVLSPTTNSVKVAGKDLEVVFPYAPSLIKRDKSQDVEVEANKQITFNTVDGKLAGIDISFDGMPFDLPVTVMPEQFKGIGYSNTEAGNFKTYRFTDCVNVPIEMEEGTIEFVASRIGVDEKTQETTESDKFGFVIPEQTKFLPRICKRDGKIQLKAAFAKDVTYVLPEGTNFDKAQMKAKFNGCREINIEVGGKTFNFPLTKEIDFSELKVRENTNPEDAQIVTVRAGAETTFVLCENNAKKKGSSIHIGTSHFLEVLEIPGEKPLKAIKLDFKNGETTIKKDVCVKSKALSAGLNVWLDVDKEQQSETTDVLYESATDTGLTGSSFEGAVLGSLKSITKPGKWDVNRPFMSLPPSSANNCNEQTFRLSFDVPKRFLDSNGCIKKSIMSKVNLDGKIIFKAQMGGENIEQEPVDVKMSIAAGSTDCTKNDAAKFSEMMKGFYVNYDEDEKNVYAGSNSKQILNFKGDTSTHVRDFVMVNNFDEDLTITEEWNGEKIVDCKDATTKTSVGGIPKTITSGAFALIECTANPIDDAKVGKAESSLIITATGAKTNDEYIKTIMVRVNNLEPGMEKIFANTPLGDLAPQAAAPPEKVAAVQPAAETQKVAPYSKLSFAGSDKIPYELDFATAVTPAKTTTPAQSAAPVTSPTASEAATSFKDLSSSVMNCQTNFCTQAQIQASYKEFADRFVQMIKGFYTTYPAPLKKFCEGKKEAYRFEKSIIIQAVNTRQQLDFENDVKEQFKTAFKSELKTTDFKVTLVKGSDTFKGCGIYVVTARLAQACTAIPSEKKDWLKIVNVEFQVKRLKDCEENLANAALLMGEQDSVESIVGREPGNSIVSMIDLSWVDNNEVGAPGGLEGILKKVQKINVGPYQRAASQRDTQNLGAFYSAMYGTTPGSSVARAEPYDDTGKCIKNGLLAAGALSVPALATIGVSALSTTMSGGGAILNGPSLIKATYGLSTGASLCGASAIQATWRQVGGAGTAALASEGVCEAMNGCVTGAVVSIGELLLSSGGVTGVAGKVLLKKIAYETLLFSGVSVGIDSIIEGYDRFSGSDQPAYTPAPLMYGVPRLLKGFYTKAYVIDYLVKNKGINYLTAYRISNAMFATGALTAEQVKAISALGITDKEALHLKGTTVAEYATRIAKDNPGKLVSAYGKLVGKNDGVYLDWLKNKKEQGFRNLQIKYLEDPDKYFDKYAAAVETHVPPLDKDYLNIRKNPSAREATIPSAKRNLDALKTETPKIIGKMEEQIVKSLETSGITTMDQISGKLELNALKDGKILAETKGAVEAKKITAEVEQESKSRVKAAMESFKKKASGEVRLLEGRGSRWTKTGLALLIPFLFHIDVRPVRGELDYQYPHHLVVYNNKNGKATMEQACATQFENDEMKCENPVPIEALCDELQDVCLQLVKGKQFTTEQGYTLFAGINKGNAEMIANAFFVSSQAPLSKAYLDPDRVKITSAAIGKLSEIGGPLEEATISNGDVREAADTLYSSLSEECRKTGECSGGITGEFLDKIRKDLDEGRITAQQALDAMLKKQKEKKAG